MLAEVFAEESGSGRVGEEKRTSTPANDRIQVRGIQFVHPRFGKGSLSGPIETQNLEIVRHGILLQRQIDEFQGTSATLNHEQLMSIRRKRPQPFLRLLVSREDMAVRLPHPESSPNDQWPDDR